MAGAVRLIGTSIVALAVMTVVLSLAIGSLLGLATVPLAAAIVLAHGLLGAVLYLLFSRGREVQFRDGAVAGFLIGVLPAQLYTLAVAVSDWGWPTVLANARDPGVWFGEAAMIVLLGVSGAFGAVVFLLVMRAGSGPATPVSPKP